jgi:hypothetical protein
MMTCALSICPELFVNGIHCMMPDRSASIDAGQGQDAPRDLRYFAP